MSAPAGNYRAILAGLVGGTLAGLGAHELRARSPGSAGVLDALTDAVAYPVGQVFLRLLFIVVVPLVFLSLIHI